MTCGGVAHGGGFFAPHTLKGADGAGPEPKGVEGGAWSSADGTCDWELEGAVDAGGFCWAKASAAIITSPRHIALKGRIIRARIVWSICRDPDANRLGAVRTSPSINRNLAQAFGTLLGCRISGRGRLARAGDQSVDGRHHKEVHRRRNQQERDHGVDEVTDGKHGAADGKADRREIRLANQGRDQW